MGGRRRAIMTRKENFVWVRLDDFKNMIHTWDSSVSNNYINENTKTPIYAIASDADIYGFEYMGVIFFNSLSNSPRIYMNAGKSNAVSYDNSTWGTYADMGWTGDNIIDVYNRGEQSNIYIYYSSDASKCSSRENSALKGTLVYFSRYQVYAELSHFYVLIKESSII